MATIVEDIRTDRRYVLLGAGLAAWASSRPSALLGTLVPSEKTGSLETICVCDANGVVDWLGAEFVRVVSVDERPPREVLEGVSGA